MSNEKMELDGIRLDKLPDELIALIANSLTLQENSHLACTNKRMQVAIYKTFTSYISPYTNNPLTHQQAIDAYSRYLAINGLLESHQPGRLSEYFSSLKLDDPSSRSAITLVSGCLSLLTGTLASYYVQNYDMGISDEMKELPWFGTKIAMATVSALTLSEIYRSRDTINFNNIKIQLNKLNGSLLFDVAIFGYTLFQSMVAIGGFPAALAYWCGANKATAGFISAISTTISILPTVTPNNLTHAVSAYYRHGYGIGFMSGIFSAIPTSIVGLIRGNTWEKIGEGLSASSITSSAVGGVAGIGLLITDYCGQRFFQQREVIKNNLIEEQNQLMSALKL